MKKCRKLGSAHGWLACSLCLLLVISSLVQPLISSASERRLTPGFSSTQQPNAEGRKVTPLAPERGTPTGLNLPNLDAVRYRQRQELKAPPAIESTMRSRRKAQKPQQKQKSHHAISRRRLNASLSTTNLVAPQSNPPSFTDDPLKDPNNPDSFKIKALHLTELRNWINLLRNRRGLGDYAWVKPAASGGAINSSVLISWEPIDEMRTALNQAIGPPANGYAQGLGLNQWILAAHIQELRDLVKSEWGSSLADQLVPARIDLFNQSGNQIQARDAEWGMPLISLPGRTGLDLGISLTYSSLVWSTAGSAISFDDDRGDPSPGFKLGFPTIQGRYIDNQVGTNVYLLITSAGRRVELRRVGSSNIYEAGDSSYLQLIENGNTLLLHTTDGTQMSYAKTGSDWHCTGIEDRNGNLISATYNGDDLATVTDTLSRVFYFNYDANRNLTSISQNWSGWWRDLATFGWGTQTLHPAFSGYTVVGAYDGEVIPVLTQVGLMDGSHYNFEYSDRGQVNMIRHYAADGAPGPAGDLQLSYMAYNYESPAGDCPRISAARLWATNWNIVNGAPAEVATSFADNHDGTHQMTTPDGTVYKEIYGSGWRHGLVTSSQFITGSTVQKTTTSSWTQDNEGVGYQTNPRVYQTLVSDATNNRKTTIGYQTFTLPVSNASCSLPNEVNEFAADQTTVLRRTHTDYNLDTSYIDPNYQNLNRRIIGLPSATLMYEGASTLKSKTTYVYDQGGEYLQNTSAAAIQHDDSHYPIGVVGRGNLTKAIRWDVNDPNQTANTADKIAYDTTGNVIFTRDALDHQTSISYADKFSASGVNLDAPRSFSTFAYPTSVTDADGFSASVWYNYDFAARTRTQGPPPQNQSQGIIQTFSYDEAMRLKQVTTVNTGAYAHYDYGPDYTSSFASVNTVAANYWQSDLYTNSFFDGLGRVFAVASNHPGSNGGNKGQYTRYDQMGRAVQQTNPFEMDSGWNPTGDDVAGYQFNVPNTFDWKGRPLRSYNMDGTYKEASYAGCGCAGGEVTTLTDEGTMDGGVAKRRQQKIYADVLGRTVKTELLNWEGGSVYATTVNTYNAQDQVTLVRQFQGNESSATYQDTTVTYDGYGRLKTTHAPRQDANTLTTYNYNADDTALSVIDARGASETFSYNNNRHLPTGITYSAPSGIATTPNVTLTYDAVGNRTSMSDGMGSVNYQYDQLSRMTSEARTFADTTNTAINGVTKTISYDNNLANELTSVTDPAGMTINYGFDVAGRLNNVTGSAFGTISTYASDAQYRAWGGLKHLSYGDSKTLDATYTSRLQAASFSIPGVMSKTYDYSADGQLRFSSDLLNHKFDRSYSHDHLGRLTAAFSGAEARGEAATNDRPYKQTFAYDGFNHLTGRTGINWSDSYTMPQDPYVNDRRDGWEYDAEGNLLGSPEATYTYDARGEIRTAGTYEPQSTTTRGLDGDGQQLRTVESTFNETSQAWASTTTYYLHSTILGGQVLTELAEDGSKARTFVYAGGAVLATHTSYGTNQAVEWEHRDPSNASYRLTAAGGSVLEQAELDPFNADAGTHAPLISPNPGDDSGTSLLPYPSFMSAQNGLGTSYRVDHIIVSADYFAQQVDSLFHGSSLQMAEYFSTPRLRNYEVDFGNSERANFGRDYNRALNAARSVEGATLVTNYIVNDNWSFASTLFSQNPYDPKNNVRLTPDQVRALREDTEKWLKARTDCMEFISSLFITVGKNTQRPLYSAEFLSDPIKIIDAVESQGGFRVAPSLKYGGAAYGSLGGKNATIFYPSFYPGFMGHAGLGEILHHAGTEVYLDRELAWAGYETLVAQGYDVSPPPKTNEVNANSNYFHNTIQFKACNPNQVKR